MVPYFRLRWIDQAVLRRIPHDMDGFFAAMNDILFEELEWAETVQPREDACELLLPQWRFFSATSSVRHLWKAATERGIERIRQAARACELFQERHWLPTSKNGERSWMDTHNRIFDHRGARHGLAPFPRGWKFSHQLAAGFHYDVTSKESRAFHITAANGIRHTGLASGHLNVDPHGHVRLNDQSLSTRKSTILNTPERPATTLRSSL